MNNENGGGDPSLGWIAAWLAVVTVVLHGTRLVRRGSGKCLSRGELSKPPTRFRLFQCNFIVPMILVYSCDWLSGPYTYVRFEEFGLSHGTINRLYLCGYMASAFAALFVGPVADRYGRRNMCIVFCLSEMVNCALFTYKWLPFLVVFRLLGGFKSCIMWTCFEAWMVQQHRLSAFPDEYLTLTFSMTSLCNALSGVTCGFLTSFLANRWGTIAVVWAPFTTAFVAFIWILVLWQADNTPAALLLQSSCAATTADGKVAEAAVKLPPVQPQQQHEEGLWEDEESRSAMNMAGCPAASSSSSSPPLPEEPCVSAALRHMRKDYRIALVGVAQAAFGSSLMLFAVNWTPALPRNIDHGLVFALFMLAMTAGSAFLPLLTNAGADATVVLFLLLCGAIASFAVVSATSAYLPRLLAFLLLEAAAGGTYPSLSVLQSRYLPEKLRATIISLYRFPLEGIVGLTLALGPHRGVVSIYQQCLAVCAAGALAALGLAFMRKTPQLLQPVLTPRRHNGSAEEECVVFSPEESTTVYS